MTVQTEISRSGPYAGAGTTGPFTVGFRFLADTHLQVIRSVAGIDTTLVLGVDYAASGVGGTTGTVTLVTPLAVGQALTIIRNVPFTQQADYVDNDSFPAESHEAALDLLTMEAQQLKEQLGRALTLPPTVASGISAVLPTPASNKLIGWNQAANALQNIDPTLLATIVAFSTANCDVFTGTGAQTTFTLAANPGSLNNLDVAIGGVTQTPGIDYTWTSGTALVFTTAPPNGMRIQARYLQALPQGTTDSATSSFIQSGAGTTMRNAQDKMRESLSVLDFPTTGGTTAQFQAAINNTPDGTFQTIHIPRGSYTVGALTAGARALSWVVEQGATITGTLPGSVLEPLKGLQLTLPSQAAGGNGWRFEIKRTDTPLNYAASSKAVMVVQDKDTSNLGDGESAPGCQFDFVSTGNGFVNSATRFSNSVWQGIIATQDKTGDGSGHCYTALGQLNAVGSGGYNEMGLYQGTATNLGSTRGGMSGVEVLLADGIGSGVGQNFDTSINAVIGRVKRFNAGTQPVSAFFASSEGPIAATAVLRTNTNGPNGWFSGIDLAGAGFSTGHALVMPNNTFVAGVRTDSVRSIILGVDGSNQTIIRAASATGGVSLLTNAGVTVLATDNDPNDNIVIRVGGAAKRVTVGAVDSGGAGFRMLRVLN